MSYSKSLVLVTGATGFLGSHVVHQLLKKGYRVRGAARSNKLALLQEGYAQYQSQFEAVSVEDISSGDLADILKDVDSVIHLASPLAGRAEPEATLDGAIKGALNVLRQGEKAGIKKFVVTSSVASLRVPGTPEDAANGPFTDQDWNTTTRKEALDGTRSPMWIYAAAKTLAERAVWEFADQHPHIDVTTLNPPFIYGPFAPGFRVPEYNIPALSTNAYIYELITGTPGGDLPPSKGAPRFIDVRDAACAHVAALEAPSSSAVKRKRILVGGGAFEWADAVEHIAINRPELRSRLPSTANAPRVLGNFQPLDTSRAKDVLGIKEFIKWEDTVIASIDSLVSLEEAWENKA